MLHYRIMGEGTPLIIVHGLFGSSDNWQTLAKEFSEQFCVVLVDQRNHGHSLQTDDVFDYDLMALDLLEVIEHEGWDEVLLLGHSMGGKTVIRLAQMRPDLVQGLVVADMGIKGYPPHHDAILKGLNAVDLDQCKSRKEVEAILAPHIPNFSVRMFLMKNLYWKVPGQLGWRINVPVLTRDILRVVGPLDPIPVDSPSLFVIGGASNYVLEADEADLKTVFREAEFHRMEGIGHWLHAEDPKGFFSIVSEFLLRITA